LGTGQLSLAKFLFITADDTNQLHTHNVQPYLEYIFERIDLTRDLHFHTNTTIDTLDYSGTGLNSGSKLVLAAYGDKKRELCREVPQVLKELQAFENPLLCMPGVVALQTKKFTTYNEAQQELDVLNGQLSIVNGELNTVAQIVVCDDSSFVAANLRNYLWVTYTRCNPSHDVYGIGSFVEHKHWGCKGPVVFDVRMKPHNAPALEKDPEVEKKVDRLFVKGGSLEGIEK
jgi:4-hydroxy-3-polyprenylbenzoate decarboxylase